MREGSRGGGITFLAVDHLKEEAVGWMGAGIESVQREPEVVVNTLEAVTSIKQKPEVFVDTLDAVTTIKQEQEVEVIALEAVTTIKQEPEVFVDTVDAVTTIKQEPNAVIGTSKVVTTIRQEPPDADISAADQVTSVKQEPNAVEMLPGSVVKKEPGLVEDVNVADQSYTVSIKDNTIHISVDGFIAVKQEPEEVDPLSGPVIQGN